MRRRLKIKEKFYGLTLFVPPYPERHIYHGMELNTLTLPRDQYEVMFNTGWEFIFDEIRPEKKKDVDNVR